jgi:hypothetical protein
VIDGVTIISGGPRHSRGIYNGGSLTLNDSAVSNGYFGYYVFGGGIDNANAAMLTLNDSAVSFSDIYGTGIENDGGTVTLNASTVSGGAARHANGIINGLGGTLTLKESTVGPTSGNGISSGISNGGAVTITDSAVIDNGGDSGGGGIMNYGTMTLKESTVSGNYGNTGGGIINSGTLTLKESTVSGNGAYGHYGSTGGGIINGGLFAKEGGTMTLSKSTVSGNSVDSEGGGIINGLLATMTLKESTVSGNSTGGGGGIENIGSLTQEEHGEQQQRPHRRRDLEHRLTDVEEEHVQREHAGRLLRLLRAEGEQRGA